MRGANRRLGMAAGRLVAGGNPLPLQGFPVKFQDIKFISYFQYLTILPAVLL
jgi:hypothetical protein